ncbi:MAG: DUF4091 domain-containing protein [Clostridia bacterium]|nr:DUF4091 domain-containing protein [Clostridia bacterium]
MNICIKQISSLEKIRNKEDMNTPCITNKTILAGECFSYQIGVFAAETTELKLSVVSPIKEYVKLYLVKGVFADFPVYQECCDDDFITKTPGIIPDLLVPAETEDNSLRLSGNAESIWVELKSPRGLAAGEYPITVCLECVGSSEAASFSQTLKLSVLPAPLPKQETIFTQWFHADCIADAHNVEIYSEKHWELIDKYMQMAAELGINMLLTPVITPPLDTAPGAARPCTQLVKIEKKGEKFIFDFSLLKRWIDLCRKHGIEYFEISHLFSQWGLEYSPNIRVKENGREFYMFGWDVKAADKSYKDFLESLLPELTAFLKSEGIADKCYFHISDEPKIQHIDAYRYAYNLVKPMLEGFKTMDALSNLEFFKSGLVPTPVTSSNHIEPFLEYGVDNQWVYYCCAQHTKVGNRFIAMPSYRNRILGLQIYKFGIKGFLQWGYNFYYCSLSRFAVNPYINTSCNKAYPSGDAFSVYPGTDGPLPSLRALIFREALQDIEICRMLERLIGRDAVIEMIDKEAGMNLTFSEYPRNSSFIPNLIEKMEKMIKERL